MTAALAFFVQAPDLFHHFGAVWAWLNPEEFDVVVYAQEPYRSEIIAQATQRQLNWVQADTLLKNNMRYEYLVSNHPNYIELIQKIAQYQIRFMYSLGKAAWNFADWNDIYDVALVFGPCQAQALQGFRCKKIQMGYPRFDRLYNGEIDLQSLRQSLQLSADKKTVVWLPTWEHGSSIDLYAAHLSQLGLNYNVIVKPHPLSFVHEPERIQRLRALPFTSLVGADIDSVELYAIADYVVCDYGGPAFGAIYADKNLLLLDVPDAISASTIGPDSFEHSLRQVFPTIHAGHDQNPREHLQTILDDGRTWQEQRSVRKQLREVFFAPYYGFSGQVAALTLKNIAQVVRL